MRLLLNNLQCYKTILILHDSHTLLLSITGVTWSFALFMQFGGSLEQRHFTPFGKRQKLGNFRGLEWALVSVISN